VEGAALLVDDVDSALGWWAVGMRQLGDGVLSFIHYIPIRRWMR